ncbi:CC0125/CC1285 family lipoprotein [Acinetobacter junii]|uniref:CC0125/CC1285 family lipoprotein n=1 Tax=Acinetobacter junii TaxID=40215 RepID=UPI00301B57ED
MKYIYLIFATLFISACSTGYKSSGLTGGFEETELAPGYYRINFRGNAFTSGEKVSQYALLRASELMLERSCNSFEVLNGKDYVNTLYMETPRTSTTNASAYVYGNYATGSATTTSYGGGLQSINKASTTLDVRCVNQEADPSRNIYDSQFLNQKLKKKYRIK